MMSSTSKPGHVAGVLRGLAADLVEVGRHGDHHLAERRRSAAAASMPQLVEDPGLDHLGRILLALEDLVEDALAHVALGALGHVVGLGGHGLERLLADDHVVAVEQHHAGREPIALGVDQRDRPALARRAARPPRTSCPGRCRWREWTGCS